LELCDVAAMKAGATPMGPPKIDLLVFPEFTFTGYNFEWTRDDWQKVAIEVPGEETEIIGKKAKELDAYIVFTAHTKDPKNWPQHYFNTSLIIDPRGEVIHQHWKAYRCTAGVYEWATTVHDVLDKFVEMYGWDAIWPIAQTPIGNLATYVCSEGFAPETARAFAFKGAEILCRCWGGGGSPVEKAGKGRLQFRADCANSLVYGIMANCANGGSMIVDPLGRIQQEILDDREGVIFERIPIAQFRSEHARPFIRTEIYVPSLTQVPGRFPPNMYLDNGVPYSSDEAFKLCEQHARFWSPWTANR
ncbi:nitrilase-related carbon-nitrogen hydrolase, partial [Chloroflexota bacterium]